MLEIKRLSPVIGAEVSGANLISPNDDEFKELEQALSEYLSFFSAINPDSAQSSKLLLQPSSDLHSHPAAPVLEDDKAIFVIKLDANSKVANGNGWHTDVSCDNEPIARNHVTTASASRNRRGHFIFKYVRGPTTLSPK